MQDTVSSGPSRTPRPAHPAQLAADRLVIIIGLYGEEHFTVEEIEAFHVVRRVLWRIAEEDDS